MENTAEALFGSFTRAVGLALGELLLLSGRPEELDGCLSSIEVTAYATLLCSELRGEGAPAPRGRSLATVAIQVVREWYKETDDLESLGEAIEALQTVLEAMGVRFVGFPTA